MNKEETIRISPEEMEEQRRFSREFAARADRPQTYHIVTYGCQMNAHDSEKLAGILEDMGMTAAPTREDADFVPELDFVMERAGQLIGQNVFVRAAIRTAGGAEFPIVTMGPIWIAPGFQGQGYGRRLLDYTLARAAEQGFSAVCLEGNIGFYGPSGFRFARTFGLRYHGLPAGADDSFFLCRELRPGALADVTGEYATPPGYLVDEAEAEAFDRAFPPREKLKLPGQLV